MRAITQLRTSQSFLATPVLDGACDLLRDELKDVHLFLAEAHLFEITLYREHADGLYALLQRHNDRIARRSAARDHYPSVDELLELLRVREHHLAGTEDIIG